MTCELKVNQSFDFIVHTGVYSDGNSLPPIVLLDERANEGETQAIMLVCLFVFIGPSFSPSICPSLSLCVSLRTHV